MNSNTMIENTINTNNLGSCNNIISHSEYNICWPCGKHAFNIVVQNNNIGRNIRTKTLEQEYNNDKRRKISSLIALIISFQSVSIIKSGNTIVL